MFLSRITLIAVLLITPTYSVAQDNGSLNQPTRDIVRNDISSLSLVRPAAEQGFPDAQFVLGSFYYIGDLVPQDYKEATKWFRLAAEQGNVAAQSALGTIYREGEGVPQDYKEATKWFRLAAEQGDPFAQTTLGTMYYAGDGVEKDFDEAHMWFRRAAEKGDALAQAKLGSMYYAGDGVTKNLVTSYMWLNISASNGHQESYQLRKQAASLLTRDEVALSQERARGCVSSNYKNCD